MALASPLALPTTVGIREISWTMLDGIAVNVDPFTGARETFQYDRQAWQATITLPSMNKAQAAAWQAFLASCKGGLNSFRLPDPDWATQRGSVDGSPVVDGASQTGATLRTRGWTGTAAGVLLAGDRFQLGDYLYIVLTDVTADSNGEASIDIWPNLRSSPSDGDGLTTSNPSELMVLDGNSRGWSSDPLPVFGCQFSCRSAI